MRRLDPAVIDAYALGMLLNEAFNPKHHPPPSASSPYPAPTAASRYDIPPSVFTPFKRLLHPQPKNRLSVKAFLEVGMTDSGFFSTNRLVRVCVGLDGFSIASEADKSALLRSVSSKAVRDAL